ncbi:MAG: polysaccharide deacetylase family protein [Lachnospiraceae bacterium]|nr:polysaccharide deacetylase family protein [Lachnospiraceae bacterium]
MIQKNRINIPGRRRRLSGMAAAMAFFLLFGCSCGSGSSQSPQDSSSTPDSLSAPETTETVGATDSAIPDSSAISEYRLPEAIRLSPLTIPLAESVESFSEQPLSPAVSELETNVWSVDENGWLYTNEEGSHYSSEWQTVDGQNYYFLSDGHIAAGWVTIGDKVYRFDPSGRVYKNTWMTDDSGSLYRLSPQGYALTGWYKESGDRIFYMAPDGKVQLGWQDIDGKRYYFGTDGVMLKGELHIGDYSYYLNEDGSMHTGWLTLKSGKRYYNADGTMAVGLYTISDKVYGFSSEGDMLFGLKTYNGKRYFFGSDGAAQTGWVKAEDGMHYFSAPGKDYIGWHYYENRWNFFTESGVLDNSRKYEDSPAVAITFDDGPGAYTGQILDLLSKYHVKATFFMIGIEVAKYPEEVKREAEMGMEQGNHSWDHKTLTSLKSGEIDDEVKNTNDAIAAITGSAPTVFRPPGGGRNALVDAVAKKFKMPLIVWNVDTLDWSTRDAQNTYNVVMSEVSDGDIILMHEIYKASYEAAAMIIPDLLERGYQIVTVSELAALKGQKLVKGELYSDFN